MESRKNKKVKPSDIPEELTDAMHSEFEVDEETELKLTVWTSLGVSGTEDRQEILKWAKIYGITEEDIDKYMNSFKEIKHD